MDKRPKDRKIHFPFAFRWLGSSLAFADRSFLWYEELLSHLHYEANDLEHEHAKSA